MRLIQIVIKFSAFAFICILFIQCDNKNSIELARIKQKYTAEELNYFYEVAFYDEVSKTSHSILKWNKDVYIYTEGAQKADSLILANLIEQLNKMQLPIKFSLTQDSVKGNMMIFFGSIDYLNTKLPGHFTTSYSNGCGIIGKNNALIGIRDSIEIWKKKDAIIKEEIVQSLGLTSDSWTFPGSLFFQGDNELVDFSSIDKRLLQLLYESYFTNKYSVKDFKKDFGDILYKSNSAQKIAKYIEKNNAPTRYLDSIRKMCPDGVYYKYPNKVWITLKGNYSGNDILFCQKILNQLNKALSGKLELIFTTDTVFLPRINIIHSHLVNNQRSDAFITYFRDSSLQYTYNLSSDITLAPIQGNDKNEIIIASLYRILGLKINPNYVFNIDEEGDIILKQEYFDILSLFYEPVFYSGIKLEEIEKAINIVRRTNK